MTEKEIAEVALGIYRGDIFTSNECPHKDDIGLVFLAIGFLSKEERQKLIDKNCGMFYEHMSKSGPRAVNGLPQFFSFSWCTVEDAKRIWEKVKEISEAVDDVVKPQGESNAVEKEHEEERQD